MEELFSNNKINRIINDVRKSKNFRFSKMSQKKAISDRIKKELPIILTQLINEEIQKEILFRFRNKEHYYNSNKARILRQAKNYYQKKKELKEIGVMTYGNS